MMPRDASPAEPWPLGPRRRRGILFIVSGPSGVGKDAVLHRYAADPAAPERCVTATTRPPRPDERAGAAYHFLSEADFEHLRATSGLLEAAHVYGHWYGTPRAWIVERLDAGRDVIVNVDVQGARSICAVRPDAVTIFLLPPSWEELERRLRARATDAQADIARRLGTARAELAECRHYGYWVVNEVIEDAAREIGGIVVAERCRAERWSPARA